MSKSIGQLVSEYTRANLDRHNFYANRSRVGQAAYKKMFNGSNYEAAAEAWQKARHEWNHKNNAKMQLAIAKKKAISKKLRTILKKNGLCISWGDMNQILSIDLLVRKKAEAKANKAMRDAQRAERMHDGLMKLDLA